jgi:hypothetical protein
MKIKISRKYIYQLTVATYKISTVFFSKFVFPTHLSFCKYKYSKTKLQYYKGCSWYFFFRFKW